MNELQIYTKKRTNYTIKRTKIKPEIAYFATFYLITLKTRINNFFGKLCQWFTGKAFRQDKK
jgi:hypothetical protein